MILLSCSRLTRGFDEGPLFEDIGFELYSGERVGLVGPNGAGKTTFLNCVSGLLRATGGRIVVAGHDVSRSRAHEIRARGVSRTFQNPSLRCTVRSASAIAWKSARYSGRWASLAGRMSSIRVSAANTQPLPRDQ